MNLKYFIRGLGVGIVFSAIILAIVLKTPAKEQLSEDEIKSKAVSMGMIDPKDETMKEKLEKSREEEADLPQREEENTNLENKENTSESKNDIKEDITDTKKEDTSNTTKEAKDDLNSKPTTAKEDIKETNHSDTEKKDVVKAEKKDTSTKEEPKKELQKVSVTIKRGMYSNHVADELKRLGIIKDSNEFDRYLIKYGYQSKILTGNYEISTDATYDQIAKLITRKK